MDTCATPHQQASATIKKGGTGLCLAIALLFTAQASGAPKELPEARVGKAYEYAVVHQGLIEPVKVQWQGLPSWLAADGPRLHGTPQEIASKPLEFAVILTGQLGDQLQGHFSLRVLPAIQPLTLAKPAIILLPIGEPINIPIAAHGGEGRLTWEVRWTARIAGLDVQVDNKEGTCRLTGTATAEGHFQVQVLVRDETGATDQHLFEGLTRAFATPLRIATTALPEATFSCPYSVSFAAEGGRPPYQWTIQWQGSAPPGLTAAVSTGTLAGIPTRLGEYPFLVTLRDAAGTQQKANGSLTVVSPKSNLFLVQRELPAAMVGQAFEATLCAGGLIGNTKWTISGAPSWLRWEDLGSVACRLSAVPSESGTWRITATVSATAPIQTPSGESVREIGKASHIFTLQVPPKSIPPLRFLGANPPVAVQDQPYEYCFATEGGEQPVSFTFKYLPDTITADPKGILRTRSMSQVGTLRFTVIASSADGQTQKCDATVHTIRREVVRPLIGWTQVVVALMTLGSVGGAYVYLVRFRLTSRRSGEES